MGLSLLTQASDKSEAGPLLSAMQSFGSGVEEGLSSLKTAVSSYNDSQSQAVLAAFNAEFCEEAKYEASSKKPMNFTGESFLMLVTESSGYNTALCVSCMCSLHATLLAISCKHQSHSISVTPYVVHYLYAQTLPAY